MKNFCLQRGEPIIEFTNRQRKFCYKECRDKLHHSYHSNNRSVKNSFNLFKNIVAVSENPDEFFQLYNHYFKNV